MGASNSKEEPVYVYGNGVPIGFTPQLKDVLVKDATTAQGTDGNNSTGNAESRDLADEIEKGVAKELARILEKNQLEDLRSKERQISTEELLGEIRDISQQIGGSTSESQSYERAVAARDRVAVCLRQHENKALNCWKEVGEFKSLVADLEREFVVASS
ncbi:hypothetical protein COEREDRAFT_82479 [Coemansia reversa NRRL 1564]|uniref:DUF1690-domain-containing protein n=1 Tax=Coemansia reversa (strain ATCC 12441 / NRRL 1564) TaxID=763665 RepID=A0A2G5B839_COERN|nr:hypothetical protein COEREDRAFT_82479 [Coemansia reversa NRRL 1564]|eukprot:PIA14887.1 hypothetical protein COEREDRAFT_82479 [Coemansia reversa NRRL 1564]